MGRSSPILLHSKTAQEWHRSNCKLLAAITAGTLPTNTVVTRSQLAEMRYTAEAPNTQLCCPKCHLWCSSKEYYGSIIDDSELTIDPESCRSCRCVSTLLESGTSTLSFLTGATLASPSSPSNRHHSCKRTVGQEDPFFAHQNKKPRRIF